MEEKPNDFPNRKRFCLMTPTKLLASLLVIGVGINTKGPPCVEKAGSVSCRIGTVNDKNLAKLPRNCTTLVGNLVFQRIIKLPFKINMLSKITYIKGGIIIRRTQVKDNFTFLSNVRCIENHNGPAITLEANANLYTLGLKSIENISGADGGPVLVSVGDSYLHTVDENELRKLVSVSSSDGKYYDGMFEIMEIKDDFEVFYFIITFSFTCLLVAAIIIVGHFVLKLHIPKNCDIKCATAAAPTSCSSKRSSVTDSQKSTKLR